MPKAKRKPGPKLKAGLDPDVGWDQLRFEFILGIARSEQARLQIAGESCMHARRGETLRDATRKWLVREVLFAADQKSAWRAASEYAAMVRARTLAGGYQLNAAMQRVSKDMAIVRAILGENPDLSEKEIERIAKMRKTPLSARGLRDRVSRARTAYRAGLAESARLDALDRAADD